MQNKTKLFLLPVVAVVFVGGFLAVSYAKAEATVPWCCVPNAGSGCVDSDSSAGCQTGYSAKITGACSTISGCAQYSGSTACSTVCVPSSSCTKTKTGSCSTAGYVCCESSGGSGSTTTGSGITFPTDTGLPTNSNLIKGIFTNVANWLLSIIGIVAIISFVISGIQYFLVATDEKMMETAKKTMVASIIGLVVALFGYIAVKTVEMLLKG